MSSLQVLAASKIIAEGAWLFNNKESDALFYDNLRTMGQLVPLLVARQGKNFILIDGVRRLEALGGLKREVLASVIEAPTDLDKGLARLAANQAYTWGEQARPDTLLPVLRFFLTLPEAERLDAFLPGHLGLQPRSKTWRLLKSWCALFPAQEEWDAHLTAGRVSLPCVEPLAKLEPEDRDFLEPFFRELAWSASAARQLVTLLFETARAQGRCVAALPGAADLHGLLDAELSPKDRMARILDGARRLRYPTRSAMEDTFAVLGRELTAGTPWRVTPEVQFETDALHLTAKMRSPEDALTAAESLRDMARSTLWKRLGAVAQDAPGAGGGES